MSTSIHEGIVDLGTSLYGTADDPVGNLTARDGVANGLLHAADSMGQVRVNWHPIAAAVANGQASYLEIATPTEINQWRLLGEFGRWPLTLRQDGTPYRLVVRVGGAMSAVPLDEKGGIKVVISPTYGDAVTYRDSAVDFTWSASVTSTTVGWLAGVSGLTGYQTYMDVPRAVADRWIRTVSIYDAVSSASPTTVDQCLVSAWVFGRAVDDVEYVPRLHALYLREYIAP